MDCSLLGSLSMEFLRQNYWSGLPFAFPGHLSDPGIEPSLLHLLHWQADSLPLVPPEKSSIVHTVGYHSALRRNEVLKGATACMNLEDIMITQMSQSQKDKYYIIALT